MAKKITKREMFAEVRTVLEGIEGTDNLIEFIDHEIELLAKKANRKSSNPNAEGNEVARNEIIEFLTANPSNAYTVTELLRKAIADEDFTNQRLTRILTALVNEDTVKREIVKGKAMYSIA